MYEDWRGGLDSSRAQGNFRRGTIHPEIQEQIDYIAAKERARNASDFMSLADAHLECQMQTVGHSIGTMSTVLERTLTELGDITNQLRTYGFEVLEIARALDGENSPHLNRLTTVAQGMIAIMAKSSDAESVIQQTKESLMKDLKNVRLATLVPEWGPPSSATEEGAY